MMTFEFVLFALDKTIVRKARPSGITTCLVDWEYREKNDRQKGFDTQINRQTLDDLLWVKDNSATHVICRINSFWEKTAEEIDLAIHGGAHEILLPMVRTVREVERVLDHVKGRAGVGILVETLEAVEVAKELGKLPLSRVYVGLNDLAIERNADHIFTPILDGTLEAIRDNFSMPFGFGGVTLIGYGAPLPTHLFLAEMIRLRCSFSFLRRSFLKDLQGHSLSTSIATMQKEVERLQKRGINEIQNDRRSLLNVLQASCIGHSSF